MNLKIRKWFTNPFTIFLIAWGILNILQARLTQLNNDEGIDGFIVQLPLPKHISEYKVIEAINPRKDVDGFHPINIGRMVIGLPAYVSATPAGIIELLRRYKIQTAGKNCVF